MNRAEKLQEISNHARYLIIRTLINSGMGHPGGSLSAADVLTALYFEIMNIDANKPDSDTRDRFIMSKGHCSLGLLTVLHLKGFITKEELATFRLDGSNFGAHLDIDKMPGVEMSTGSLGHGLSVGVGRALAAKIDRKDFLTYVLMGDGENQEGSIWEAAMSAANYKLDNLIGIVDRNNIQQCGFTEDIMSIGPLKDKWQSFGWSVQEIDGHNMNEIVKALKQVPFNNNKPSLIISKTIKGKGISFMENDNKWHGGGAIKEFADQALEEVEKYKYEGLIK
jgi:transketolase